MSFLDQLQTNMHFSESEESDEDHGFAKRCPTIEDVRDEMDIARFYRSLCSNSMFNQRLKSRSIQTEHDSSCLTPSWLIAGQKYVDELYNGLGNAINSLHQPSNFTQKFPSLADVPNMKYFSYENGYWRFRLDPSVRFPADSETYRQMQIINTENFRNNLERLMQVATKLRDLVSYLDDDNGQPIGNSANGNQTILKEDKCQQTEFSNSVSQFDHNHQETKTSEEILISFTDISDGPSKIDYISSSEENSSEFAENPRKIDFLEDIEVQNMNSLHYNTKAGKSCKIVPNVESSQVPGIKVLRYKLHPGIRRCVSDEVEMLNPYERVGVTRNTNFVHTGLVSKIPMEKRKMFGLSKVKNTQNCSNLVNQASQPSTSKFQVPSAENAVNKFERFDRKFVKPLGDHNIPDLERARSLSMKNDFPCKRPRIATSGNACKNFIKQNILASKLPPTRAGLSHVKCEALKSTSQDVLPLTHDVAGRSSSPQPKHTNSPRRQFSSKNRNRIFK